MTVSENIAWAQTLMGMSKRTVICSPEVESRVKETLRAHGFADWKVIVNANPGLCDNKIFLIDEEGLEARQREWLQSLGKNSITDLFDY